MSQPPELDTTSPIAPGDLLFALAAATSDAFVVKDVRGRYLFANDTLARLVRRPVHEMIGHDDIELFGPEEGGRMLARDRAVIETATEATFIERVRLDSGRLHTFHTTKGPILDADGRVVGLFAVSRDISRDDDDTEREQANRELRESEARYRTLVTAMHDGVFVAQHHRFVLANPAMHRMLGYEPGELEGAGFADVVDPEYLALWIARFDARTAGANPPGVYELRMLRRDRGEPVLVELNANRVEYGDSTAVLGIVRDIGDRRRLELAREQELYEMLDRANDSILVRDRDNRILYWNGGAERVYGWTANEARGRLAHELLDTEFDTPLAEIEQVLRAQGSWQGEFRQRRRDGRPIVIASRLTAKLDAQGAIARVLAINQDITSKKETEARIGELNRELGARSAMLEARNRELEAFGYSVSHDLKAPLRAIDGYGRLLMDTATERLDEESQGFLANIRRATVHMGTLIDDLLAYCRVDRSDEPPAEVSLGDVVRRALDERRQEIAARKVEVIVHLDVDLIQSERRGLTLALGNLIDNAVKFTQSADAPRIEIGSHRSDGEVVIDVRDNGVGFDMKYHDRIFEIFQRLHRAEDYPGTGIGLAIVRKSVDRLRGRVWADSVPGEGSVFHVALPDDSAAGKNGGGAIA